MRENKNKAEAPRKKLRTPRKIDARYLENAALYYLQRYASSVQNLKNILLRKIQRSCRHHGEDPAPYHILLEKMLARYQAAGLLDDAVYAEGRVRALRRQGLSRQMILHKLQAKGLPAAEVALALEKADNDTPTETAQEDPELSAARRLARRKRIGPWRTNPTPEGDTRTRQRDMAALARAGFSYDIARQALALPAEED